MTAGPYTVLNALTLTPTEISDGYANRGTDGGVDVQGEMAAALAALLDAQAKLTLLVSVLPSGSNKTAVQGQLTLLSATS